LRRKVVSGRRGETQETMSSREPGIESQRTIAYRPSTMSFKEYDKKMRSFRPDLEYWETVLTVLRSWEEKKADGSNKYTVEQQKTILATDRIAKSVYVLGNGGATDVYTNQETAYEIREALRARYENTEQWGLTTLTEKYNEVVRANQHACPDVWFDNL
jgi:hypothetical protein